MTAWKAIVIAAALFMQQDVVRQLQLEKLSLSPQQPNAYMVEIHAVHEDGTGARGTITCDGLWRKFDEQETVEWNLPFATDSRGVAIFNPWIGDYEDGMHCTARDTHQHIGQVSFWLPASHIQIVVR
jgi:hypothetical protein